MDAASGFPTAIHFRFPVVAGSPAPRKPAGGSSREASPTDDPSRPHRRCGIWGSPRCCTLLLRSRPNWRWLRGASAYPRVQRRRRGTRHTRWRVDLGSWKELAVRTSSTDTLSNDGAESTSSIFEADSSMAWPRNRKENNGNLLQSSIRENHGLYIYITTLPSLLERLGGARQRSTIKALV